jgi:hypothetical protein
MMGMMRILKSFRLFYINFFLKNTVQKSTLYIHLIHLESKMASDGENNSYGFKPGNRSKGFIKVYSLNLSIMISRSGNQSLNIISGKLMELVMHGRHPAFILLSFVNFLGFCLCKVAAVGNLISYFTGRLDDSVS